MNILSNIHIGISQMNPFDYTKSFYLDFIRMYVLNSTRAHTRENELRILDFGYVHHLQAALKEISAEIDLTEYNFHFYCVEAGRDEYINQHVSVYDVSNSIEIMAILTDIRFNYVSFTNTYQVMPNADELLEDIMTHQEELFTENGRMILYMPLEENAADLWHKTKTGINQGLAYVPYTLNLGNIIVKDDLHYKIEQYDPTYCCIHSVNWWPFGVVTNYRITLVP